MFKDAPFGLDILTASVVLAIMIIPTISAVSREILLAVPAIQREAAYMLGATKWEVFRMSVLPYAKSGLIGASILGFRKSRWRNHGSYNVNWKRSWAQRHFH